MSRLIPRRLHDLEFLVEEGVEESATLEFKRQLPPSGQNDDLAKLLAAMANSGGGVIVYGVEDEGSKASALIPMPLGNSAERIALVAGTLDEPVELEDVFSIAAENEDERGFLTVSVPASDRAPHFYKGIALKRSAKGIVPLSRREVGELFARQTGFAQEFGLMSTHPGRVICRHVVEPNPQYLASSGISSPNNYYLVLENDGDEDVFEVSWEWAMDLAETTPMVISGASFPLPVMRRGEKLRTHIAHTLGSDPNIRVRTLWRDGRGNEHDEIWPLTF